MKSTTNGRARTARRPADVRPRRPDRHAYHEAWARVLDALEALRGRIGEALALPEDDYGIDVEYDGGERDTWPELVEDLTAVDYHLALYLGILESTAPLCDLSEARERDAARHALAGPCTCRRLP